MIASADGNFTLQNVGKIYKLTCLDYSLKEVLGLFENIPNFRVISINLKSVFHGSKIIDRNVEFKGKGVYDCLQELSYDIPADELNLVGFQILWYDEVIQ